jgi:hypothetical protein
VRDTLRPGPGPWSVKNLNIYQNGPVLHFFPDERTAEIG